MAKLTPERIRESIVQAGYHYGQAAQLLGITPDTLRSRITFYKAHGEEFPKSRARGGRNQPPERTREEFDAARNEIRRQQGLPECEYDHGRGN
jgi:hypothetical protein